MLRSLARRAPLGAVTAALVLAASAALAGDTAEATGPYRFAKGDKLRFALKWNIDESTAIMGMAIDRDAKLAIGISNEVTDVDASGAAKVKATIESIALET